MKMNKKKVFTLALAVCLIAILSLGSLAWFSDSDKVDNQFLVAGSDTDNPDDIFSVDVWEDSTKEDTEGEKKEQNGIEYTNILPGDQLYKEVVIENTGAYDQYIRAIVTISDAAAWKNALGENFNDETLLACFEGFNPNLWDCGTLVTQGDNIMIVAYYKSVLAEDEKVALFTGVNIPTSLTEDQAHAFGADGFTIDVVAHAVQTQNVGENAFAAFQTVGWSAFDADYEA